MQIFDIHVYMVINWSTEAVDLWERTQTSTPLPQILKNKPRNNGVFLKGSEVKKCDPTPPKFLELMLVSKNIHCLKSPKNKFKKKNYKMIKEVLKNFSICQFQKKTRSCGVLPLPPPHNMLRDCRVYENVVACIIGPLHYRTFPAELGKTLPERHEKLHLICIVV